MKPRQPMALLTILPISQSPLMSNRSRSPVESVAGPIQSQNLEDATTKVILTPPNPSPIARRSAAVRKHVLRNPAWTNPNPKPIAAVEHIPRSHVQIPANIPALARPYLANDLVPTILGRSKSRRDGGLTLQLQKSGPLVVSSVQ